MANSSGTMDRMRQGLLIATAIVVIVCPANAQERTPSGNDLIEACRSIAGGTIPTPDKSLQAGVCLGEIEALDWLAPGQEDERLRSCVPSSATRQQMAEVVVAYLDQNRDRLSEPFEGLALEALARMWPCKEEPGWFEKWFNKKE
jgi:hypothetical protein